MAATRVSTIALQEEARAHVRDGKSQAEIEAFAAKVDEIFGRGATGSRAVTDYLVGIDTARREATVAGLAGMTSVELEAAAAKIDEQWHRHVEVGDQQGAQGAFMVAEAIRAEQRRREGKPKLRAVIVKPGTHNTEPYAEVEGQRWPVPMGWNMGQRLEVGTKGTAQYVATHSAGLWRFVPDEAPL